MIPWFVVVASVVSVIGFVYYQRPVDTTALIRDGIIGCLDERRPLWHGPCFRDLADRILARMTPEESLRTLADLDDEQPVKSVCHALVHYIGQDMYAESGDLQDTLARCSSVIACGEGCLHGAVEGYLTTAGSDFADIDLAALCVRSQAKNEMDYRACVHGIGHALMLVTDGDIPGSLAACDAIDVAVRDQCLSGVFMENVFGHQYLGNPGAYVDLREPRYPCTIVDEMYLARCYASQASFVIQNDRRGYDAGAEFCAAIDPTYRAACYGALGAQSVVGEETPHAVVQACARVPDGDAHDECIRMALYFRIQMTAGDAPSLGAICGAVPEARQEACAGAAGETIALWFSTRPEDACRDAFADTRLLRTCEAALSI